MMLPKGTRVEKTRSAPGDGHQDGDKGIISSVVQADPLVVDQMRESLCLPEDVVFEGAYFVLWDDMPQTPVFTADYRIKKCL